MYNDIIMLTVYMYFIVLTCHVNNVSSHCLQEENNRLTEVCTKFVMS